ncbi:mariner Mos1 transposase [Trichonephila clavipes]|nr:mariner Mos1 transposase [Trichonephila clavipes]
MLVEAYGGNALSCAQCYRWFEKFQNGDFDVRNEECSRPAKKFEDAELQALLDEDDGQTQEHLAEQLNVDQSPVSRRLKAMDKIIKQYEKRQHKVIFFDDDTSHRAKPTKDIVKELGWEPLAHAAYSPDLAPSDYHLFASFGLALADQRFTSYEYVKSWLDDWLASKKTSIVFMAWYRSSSWHYFPDGDRFNSCQVIYSQFGLAIHQNDHQARRRFVEWVQNEIAVVPDFHKRILFSDEAHFWLVEWLRQQTKLPHLSEANPQELWLQQDGATCHTARATIDLLKDTFDDRLISHFGPVNWPPRSCDLTPIDYFLWGYVKSLVYADKPQTLDHLEDNIRRGIADIRPQMLEKVIEN